MTTQEQLALFGGETFDAQQDAARLTRQLNRVRWALQAFPGWWTLAELAEATGAPEASVSARLRDLRKAKHGGFTIERRRVDDGHGLHEYRIVQ